LNIENETDDFLNNIKGDESSTQVTKLPDEEITPYTLWIKNELEPYVSRVILSKRLTDTPILITSQVSATMKAMMAMMQQEKVNKILTKFL
jgi:molecular chaperone HtpG/TNF receptor-associated protein 1